MGFVETWSASFFLDQRSIVALEVQQQQSSLTRQFTIKWWQCDGEGLQRTQGETVVHGEDVLSYTSKLHHYVVLWGREDMNDCYPTDKDRRVIFLSFKEREEQEDSYVLPLSGWMIWKFLTEAWVTRPWKFSTYDWVCSFQLGDLFTSVTSFSVLLLAWRTSRVSRSCNTRESLVLWIISFSEVLEILNCWQNSHFWDKWKLFHHSPASQGWSPSFSWDLWSPEHLCPAKKMRQLTQGVLHNAGC